jgi:hypothetical protein
MVRTIPGQSGMDFIADNTFHIEKTNSYESIRDKGVRSVEFIRVKDDTLLLFVEAKTAFPNPNNPSAENEARFQEEIDDVCEKFTHSLNLFSSIEIGVTSEEFPDGFIVPEKVSLIFMLVVKNHAFEWCKPIKGEIEATLPYYLKKIWKPRVSVINEGIAAEQGLIVR